MSTVEEMYVRMPKLSEAMTEGKILHWCVSPGDFVKEGDVLGEVETDKANMELEADRPAYIAEILAFPGETVAVGAPLLRLAESPEGIQVAADSALSSKGTAAPISAKEHPEAAGPSATPGTFVHANEPNISPVALDLAEKLGVDVTQVSGTGPHGRIMKEDVLRVVSASLADKDDRADSASATETIKLTDIEEVTSNRSETHPDVSPTDVVAWATKHVTVTFVSELEIGSLLLAAEKIRKHTTLAPHLTATDFFPVLVARAYSMAAAAGAAGTSGLNAHRTAFNRVAIAVGEPGKRVYPVLVAVDSVPIGKLLTQFFVLRDQALAGQLRCEDCSGPQLVVEMVDAPNTTINALSLEAPSVPAVFFTKISSAPKVRVSFAVSAPLYAVAEYALLHERACDYLLAPMLLSECSIPSDANGL
jgi:pyruvate dehydrogenase E2 component (dihydrolipoamide acetyltransferase)